MGGRASAMGTIGVKGFIVSIGRAESLFQVLCKFIGKKHTSRLRRQAVWI